MILYINLFIFLFINNQVNTQTSESEHFYDQIVWNEVKKYCNGKPSKNFCSDSHENCELYIENKTF
jgi:hypothetical protein